MESGFGELHSQGKPDVPETDNAGSGPAGLNAFQKRSCKR
jgi:hypothetical protein